MKCRVAGCENSRSTVLMHMFPARNDRLLAIWLHRTQNTDLDQLSIRVCCKARAICEEHFADICKVAKVNGLQTTLKVNALPTINMPGFLGDPYSETNCLLDKETFNYGKVLKRSAFCDKKVIDLRTFGASIDKQTGWITGWMTEGMG
uniref:Putative 52 kDa repressor of the inhibitor of the protein kinase-like myzus persicae n=1 Tax=Xenopsylla cheopis TaxID=163159 RepID=A0A6M2DX20_XENCH